MSARRVVIKSMSEGDLALLLVVLIRPDGIKVQVGATHSFRVNDGIYFLPAANDTFPSSLLLPGYRSSCWLWFGLCESSEIERHDMSWLLLLLSRNNENTGKQTNNKLTNKMDRCCCCYWFLLLFTHGFHCMVIGYVGELLLVGCDLLGFARTTRSSFVVVVGLLLLVAADAFVLLPRRTRYCYSLTSPLLQFGFNISLPLFFLSCARAHLECANLT